MGFQSQDRDEKFGFKQYLEIIGDTFLILFKLSCSNLDWGCEIAAFGIL